MDTYQERQATLDRAVVATRAFLAAGPATPEQEVERLVERARAAVTAAVTSGGHLHTLIAAQVGCSGLQVIHLIGDWTAQGEALGVERNAAKNYADQVRAAARSHAVRRTAAEGHGAVSQLAREVGVSRPVVYAWLDEARAAAERPV